MRRILIVDDEHLVTDTLGLIFTKSGFDVCRAYSTDEAVMLSREFVPELLLCDINMPGRDGMELIADITRELPACRILVLTGSYASANRARDRSANLEKPLSVMTKPCQPADLLRQAGAMLLSA
jgi:CheY-like chemotaxis protein